MRHGVPEPTHRLLRLIAERQSTILAVIVLVVMLGLFEIGPLLGFRFETLVRAIPMPGLFDSLGARWVLLFFVAIWCLFAIALVLKGLEQSETARWQPAEAEILRAQSGFRLLSRVKGLPRNHRIAEIVYAFRVPTLGEDRTFTGGRIRIDEIIPEEEVDALLARYPVGRRVTVFFDPANPARNVLEREADGGRSLKGLFWLAIVFAIIAIPVMAFATHGAGLGKMIPLGGWGWASLMAGILAVGFVWGHVRQRRWLAGLQGWPTVPGTIVTSFVEEFDSGHRKRWNDGRVREVVVQFMPVVEYQYEVAGKTLLSRTIQADQTLAGSDVFARAYVDRYAPGMQVRVAYDPANPARAALEPTKGFGATFLIAGISFGLVALATGFAAWL
jgi:hypothetical protein